MNDPTSLNIYIGYIPRDTYFSFISSNYYDTELVYRNAITETS